MSFCSLTPNEVGDAASFNIYTDCTPPTSLLFLSSSQPAFMSVRAIADNVSSSSH